MVISGHTTFYDYINQCEKEKEKAEEERAEVEEEAKAEGGGEKLIGGRSAVM